jgi:hypothetical protein
VSGFCPNELTYSPRSLESTKRAIQWLPGLLEGSVGLLQISRRGLSGFVSTLLNFLENVAARSVAANKLVDFFCIHKLLKSKTSRRYFDFDQIIGFRIYDDGDSLRQYGAEFQIQSNGSLPRKIHVTVLPEIWSQGSFRLRVRRRTTSLWGEFCDAVRRRTTSFMLIAC